MAIYMGSTLYTCMYIYRPIYCLYVALYKQLYVMDLQAWVVSSIPLYECRLSGNGWLLMDDQLNFNHIRW